MGKKTIVLPGPRPDGEEKGATKGAGGAPEGKGPVGARAFTDSPAPSSVFRGRGLLLALLLGLTVEGASGGDAADRQVSWRWEGRDRTATVHLPSGAPGPGLLPLVVFLHGAGGTGALGREQTGLGKLADEEGFLVAFPDGTGARPDRLTWNAWYCCGYALEHQVDDVGALDALLDLLERTFPVDPRRIYLAGFSNGAMMAYRYALERPGRVAALGVVAGALRGGGRKAREALPVCIIHGTKDGVVPPDGRSFARPQRGRPPGEAVESAARFWAAANGNDPTPQRERRGQDTILRWTGGWAGAEVELHLIGGAGHAWPGGNPRKYRYCDEPPKSPEASRVLWRFFSRHQRP